jgi:hypothetical protein
MLNRRCADQGSFYAEAIGFFQQVNRVLQVKKWISSEQSEFDEPQLVCFSQYTEPIILSQFVLARQPANCAAVKATVMTGIGDF